MVQKVSLWLELTEVFVGAGPHPQHQHKQQMVKHADTGRFSSVCYRVKYFSSFSRSIDMPFCLGSPCHRSSSLPLLGNGIAVDFKGAELEAAASA